MTVLSDCIDEQKLTEKEIVKYLKENRTKGVGFIFMPREVRIWTTSNISRVDCYDSSSNKWDNAFHYKFYYSNIYSLPEDFELEEKPQGEWIDFDIDDEGYFHPIFTGPDGKIVRDKYFFFERTDFLSHYHDEGYTAFGGWQYGDDPRWYLAPAVELADGTFWNSYVINVTGEVKPAIPTRIRFWREAK